MTTLEKMRLARPAEQARAGSIWVWFCESEAFAEIPSNREAMESSIVCGEVVRAADLPDFAFLSDFLWRMKQ